MSEKFYVVAESELYRALDAARLAQAYPYERMEQAADDAEAACRAKEVERFYFATIEKTHEIWKEVDK